MSASSGGQSARLAYGGQIDRERPLSFTFNGRRMRGYAGDTLASALLANGVRLVGRSFKYHRPRGVLSAGSEEPNALVQLETGVRTQPNLRATQVELYDGLSATSVNAWPNVDFDVGAINNRLARLIPAGFYYKTFMWPRNFWMAYERMIRRAAGLGKAPQGPDPDRYEKANIHCDVLVVGGGPAGQAAALAAGRSGARVILADEQAEWGGSLAGARDEIGGKPALDWVEATVAALDRMEDVRLLARTTVAGAYDYNFLTAVERVTDHLGHAAPDGVPRQRLWRIRARQVVLATGAIERPLVFKNNDLPGIMLANAARTYINRYAVLPGKRVVVATNNDSAYAAAIDLVAAGAEVNVVDVRVHPDGALPERAADLGIDITTGSAVAAAHGRSSIASVDIMTLDDVTGTIGGAVQRAACDLLCISGGWNPTVHLFSQARGRLAYDHDNACFVPDESGGGHAVAGACAGDFALKDCLENGFLVGAAAARTVGFTKSVGTLKTTAANPQEAAIRPIWFIPSQEDPAKVAGGGTKHFIDFQNDVTAADVALAAQEGYRSVEHLKRYTTLGMGTDQGKTSNVTGLALLSFATGQPMADVGTTTFRPPYTPVTYGTLAGREVGALADPIRRTPIHQWHEERGAVFEDVGQWKRPFYYPQSGESKDDAVNRECLAVRNAVGILDASTLGKIELQGADAVTLLNRIYTNAWSKLEVGRCRYGLMCHEDGMIFDDGVTARLGDTRFLMTTTTGNAAAVLSWLEEWVQTEWPDLKVYMQSVTEQFATVTICGPRARDLLAEVSSGFDTGAKPFPFMAWRDGNVAGLPARIFRVSFTGELSYEINVPASFGMSLWNALMTAGQRFGITPFGTEAMHVLRAEKGYVMVGQETDGTVTPIDLGMGWAVSKTKDFIGKRSLNRPDTLREDRKQLVGLLTDDPNEVLPEGGQVVAELKDSPPMDMIGHVTSSYRSATLGRSIALALVKGGLWRKGETVHVPQPYKTVAAKVTDPLFYDPEGARLHG